MTSAQNSTESAEQGSQAPADPMGSEAARVARYAEAIRPVYDRHNLATYAKAVVAVADEEHAPLVAEVERLRGEVDRVRALADAFADDGLARYGGNIAWHIEEAIANEKGDFPDAADRRIASQRERAKAAEAKVAKVESAVDRIESLAKSRAITARARGHSATERDWLDVLAIIERAALADAPAEQRAEGGAWRDRHGDVWTLGDDGLLHTPETEPFSREHVEKKWGPLVPDKAGA